LDGAPRVSSITHEDNIGTRWLWLPEFDRVPIELRPMSIGFSISPAGNFGSCSAPRAGMSAWTRRRAGGKSHVAGAARARRARDMARFPRDIVHLRIRHGDGSHSTRLFIALDAILIAFDSRAFPIDMGPQRIRHGAPRGRHGAFGER
jgi:hypothetical protein